ncbi:MAG: hypothetical protein JRD71_02665, partial [Deltaproteobacteria bacterium]|nr:hypothetical protein [Deltaproteobacteria bacterium]
MNSGPNVIGAQAVVLIPGYTVSCSIGSDLRAINASRAGLDDHFRIPTSIIYISVYVVIRSVVLAPCGAVPNAVRCDPAVIGSIAADLFFITQPGGCVIRHGVNRAVVIIYYHKPVTIAGYIIITQVVSDLKYASPRAAAEKATEKITNVIIILPPYRQY